MNELIFDGEYKNGRIWSGKGYTICGHKLFEIKNGKGYMIEYDIYGLLKYEGEYLNGERNGKGKEYYHNYVFKYEGEYINGKRYGKGKEYYENGNLKFEGEYTNGDIWNGNGYNYYGKKEFEIKCGKGSIKKYDGKGKLIFEGNYLNGERDGEGKEY